MKEKRNQRRLLDVRSLPQYSKYRPETAAKDNRVISLFYQDITVPLSINDIAEKLYITAGMVRSSITRINESGKVLKIVGTCEKSGNLAVKYQVLESPLKEIKIIQCDPVNYSSINRFITEYLTFNKSLYQNLGHINRLLQEYFKERVDSKSARVSTGNGNGLIKVYPLNLLQEIVQSFEKSFAQPLVSPVESTVIEKIPPVTKKTPLLTKFKNLFKKKKKREEDYDIIQF